MSRDRALGFWLDYIHQEGGLVEEREDLALVLLPAALREGFGLPEEVLATSDPEIAEEAGALLLIPGHPVLDAAAARVLGRGDAGWRRLPWPRPASLPDGQRLLALARESVDVDHGRIDLDGVPASVYLPALRLAALVTYTLDQPVQEREEAWVDARGGLALGPSIVAALADLEPDEGGPARHSSLRPDLARALQPAHGRIEKRAAERLRALSREAAPRLREELANADAYFDGALASIAHRRERAPAERQRLYDAQAEATRGERVRRRREIEEKFRPRVRIDPFRLHLLLVPALQLSLLVRRGAEAYPFALTWLPVAREFAPYGCPSCGEARRLVAGRQRLGCVGCLPRPTPEAVLLARGPAPVPAPAPASVRDVDAGGEPAPSRPPGPASQGGAHRGRRPPPPNLTIRRGTGEVDRATRLAVWERERARIFRAGDGLALAFWQRVTDRRPWRRVVSGSPLAALYELYGPVGPLLAIGLPRGEMPEEVMGGLEKADFELRGVTAGVVVTAGGRWPFSLLWRLLDGRPFVRDVLPSVRDPLGTLPDLGKLPANVQHNLRRPPRPRRGLDLVAGLLWEVETARQGLPVAVRGVAAWWGAQATADVSGLGTEALAAGLASVVGRESGLGRRREAIGADYGVHPAAVTKAARRLQAALGSQHGRW